MMTFNLINPEWYRFWAKSGLRKWQKFLYAGRELYIVRRHYERVAENARKNPRVNPNSLTS